MVGMEGRRKHGGWEWWLLAWLLLALGLYGGYRWAIAHSYREPPAVTGANYERIEAGMTLERVQTILGHETDYDIVWMDRSKAPPYQGTGPPPPGVKLYSRFQWKTSGLTVTIDFFGDCGDEWPVVVQKNLAYPVTSSP
jgi:hypothetical protein